MRSLFHEGTKAAMAAQVAMEPAQASVVFGAMTEDAEGSYFASCELRERAMSRSAPDCRAAAVHAEMAERYEALAVIFGAKRAGNVPIDYR